MEHMKGTEDGGLPSTLIESLFNGFRFSPDSPLITQSNNRSYCDSTNCSSIVQPPSPFPIDPEVGKEWSWTPFIAEAYLAIALFWIFSKGALKSPTLTALAEILVCNLTLVLLLPIAIIGVVLLLIVRLIISISIKLTGRELTLMSGTDAFWAYDEFANSCSFYALYILKGNCDLGKIQERFDKEVLGKLVNGKKVYRERFSRRIIKKFGFYFWEVMANFQIKNHVRYLELDENANEDGSVIMGEDEVFEEMKKRFDHPLSQEKPQWEILVIPNYKYKDPKMHEKNEKYYGLLYRVHHSMMDGVSAGNTLQTAIADKPVKWTVDPLKNPGIPFIVKVLAYVNVLFLGPRSFLKTVLLHETNCFHGKELTGPKTLGWSKPISVEVVKQIKDETKTSVTAVLVSCLGGSLRNLAEMKGAIVPDKIHAATTIAMLPYPDSTPQNRFTIALLPMPIGLDTPMKRLKATYKNALELAKNPDILMNFTMMKVLGLLPAIATKFVMDLAHATMLLSNVPGPSETTHLFGGDPLVDVGIWAPIKSSTGIGMSLFSYDGRIRASMVADSTACSEKDDVPNLVKAFENEVADLANIAGISKDCIYATNHVN